ncbi:hypothetical protein DSM104443_02174 [Usitatibacter rugosus]|uniref:DUF1800 domain-containing protein n=1 Tax=Usitatibacter rugosus TaxID=2732067 RepID=A0A6M4GXJ0_9PROT|nr:DUF1800 family protein [Usitatibacter rugosus]QJR11103.1 hypothetical protein DSM104443_02174 [Usitatibacter rugosus]
MNAQQQSPRRRLAGFDKLIALFALLVALFTSPLASAANYTDIWWNSAESGWGVTLTHHNDKLFGVWYIYDSAGKPYWVVMSDGVFSNEGRTFTGSIHTTRGPSYREAIFRSQNVSTRQVGTAKIDFDADEENATATYTIDGMTSTKRITRQAYGIAPTNFGVDHSDMWWDDKESGWGLSVSHHGDNIFAVWYTYGEDGKPLWVVMPGGVLNGNTFTGTMYTTTGSPYMAGFDAKQTQVTPVGTAKITFNGTQGLFESDFKGFQQFKQIKRLAFGKESSNKKPTIQLAATAGASPLVAPATVTLKATAADSDGTVSKVSFFQGCNMIGADSAAPYEFTVSNLPAGKYYFSARVSDDKGGTALASTQMIEVKSGTGGGTPGGGGGGGSGTNKAPTVSITAPVANAQFAQGASITIVATAADSDGTVAKVEFLAGATKVGEALASPWQVTWSAVPAGAYSLTAVATDDKGATKTSSAISVTVIPPAIVVDAATKDAARFLTQATFGIKSIAEIDALKSQGYEGWLNQQFALGWSSHVGYVDLRVAVNEKPDEERAYEAIWQQWLLDNGQLRARMAFALSEIFVISNIAPDLDTYAMASYMDMLNKNAFGNYRQLLEDVTLHPAMGYYLNMIGSKKADPAKGTHPNENFAREVMQLFSIGLYKLNADGTRVIEGGLPVNTYDQTVIGGMAAAFTGWNFAGNDTSNAAIFNPAKENWRDPMVAWEMWHDTNAKTIFNGIVIPAGGNARGDMKAVLDALANHPNVGPFVGRELIQRFVTSNPSPAYIGRVAAAFNNNGSGVRGDLRATLRAVLMDPEARDVNKAATDPTFGKQREPVIRFANFLRGLNATSPSGRNKIWYLDSADEGLNQSPLLSPSVFNFFSPNYRQPGPLSAANLVAPEFQITTETSMVGGLNFFSKLVKNGSYGSGDTKLTMNLAELNALANTPGALADRLSLLFMNGMMSEGLRSTIVSTLGAMPAMKTNDTTVTDRVRAALILVSLSPDFVIQK